MRPKIIISIIVFFAMQQYLHGQNNAYQFSHLDISNGLSNNQVNCIYKDADGFMWFGTNSGLDRFDGYQFKVFRHSPGKVSSLSGNYVTAIYEGPDKKLWVYTHGGIGIYDPETERISNNLSKELSKYKVFTGKLTSIKKDTQKRFWFLTENDGLYCYNPKNKKTAFYNTLVKSEVVLHSNYISDVVEAKDYRIWIIYHDGVMDKLDTRTNKILLRTYTLNKANRNKPKSYMATLGNDNNLWIYAVGSLVGVYSYHLQTGKLLHYDKDTPGIHLNSNVINNPDTVIFVFNNIRNVIGMEHHYRFY